MIDESYHKQRLEGAHLIIKKAEEMAKELNISIDKIEWDKGATIRDRESHILTVTSGSRMIQEKFSDESLADFPGKVGTESTTKKIRKIIQCLQD